MRILARQTWTDCACCRLYQLQQIGPTALLDLEVEFVSDIPVSRVF